MAVLLSGADPQTRVWNKTEDCADGESSCLAAVVTVVSLYVLAHSDQKPPFPHLTDVFAAARSGQGRAGVWRGEAHP